MSYYRFVIKKNFEDYPNHNYLGRVFIVIVYMDVI